MLLLTQQFYRHHREILDTTTTLQFSGLPNNALLEMVPVQRVRRESSVTLGLQLESGDRPTGTFLPSDNLWTVVTKLCPEEEERSGKESNPVVIYMRQEVSGVEALKGMTLRNLGLTSGRAMLRFVHRTPEELRTQANVSAPLKRAQTPSKDTAREKQAKPHFARQVEEATLPNVLAEGSVGLVDELPPAAAAIAVTEADAPACDGPAVRDGAAADKMDVNEEGLDDDRKESRVLALNGGSGVCMSDDVMPDVGENAPILLGERSALVFLLDSAPDVEREELPDSFFDLTVEDARVIYNDLITKRAEMEDAPLSTTAMRELEKSKQVLNNLHQYRKVVLRVQFPDRTVLQGMFSPIETVHKVMEFVRQYLENPGTSFYLFTTPPKQILAPEVTLVEAGCVPSALLHFGCDTGDLQAFIRPDVLARSSSFRAAATAARYSRRKTSERGLATSSSASEKRPPSPQPSTSRQSDDPLPARDHQARVSHSKGSSKVPKWFKAVN
ncbi:tether containing UBX domain for GLUT4 isoform X2 [Bacillus rossius redtenbacheri]|uniref:tether containing UBX domain for GLUT4 isoform X2 n=1 Tax=Bacillus rossius redtenbacheri TaxID=93214 RepID=UPI002FDE8869